MIFMIRWRNWSLHLISSKCEDSKGKGYTDFSISGMGYIEYTQEEQCPVVQKRPPSIHRDVAKTLLLRRYKTEYT